LSTVGRNARFENLFIGGAGKDKIMAGIEHTGFLTSMAASYAISAS